jgi:hypothetical protein
LLHLFFFLHRGRCVTSFVVGAHGCT